MQFSWGIRWLLRLFGKMFEEPERQYAHSERDAIDLLSQVCDGTAGIDCFLVTKGLPGSSLYIGGNSAVLILFYNTAEGRVYVLDGDVTQDRVSMVIKAYFADEPNVLYVEMWEDN